MEKTDKFSNKEIAELLRSIAAVYLLKNENRFRIIAYENAANAVELSTRELKDLWEEGKLNKVPGIGASLNSHLTEYFEKGESTYFNEVMEGIPASLFVLMRVPGLGPKKAFKLTQEFKLIDPATVVTDLIKIAEEGKIEHLPTFGKESQQNILESLQRFDKNKDKAERMPMPYALEMANDIAEYIKQLPYVKKVDTLGSLRRRVSTIGDIDLAVVAPEEKSKEVVAHFIEYPGKLAVDNKGDKKASIIVPPNIRVDMRVQDEESYGAMLQYFTGSKGHNIKLREFALRKNLSLNEYGMKKVERSDIPTRQADKVSRDDGEKKREGHDVDYKFADEPSFYKFLGLAYPPPEIREGANEIEMALKNELPELVTVEDIKGDFHMHSSYDISTSHDVGANTYEELVKRGEELGYDYIGFADHNPKTSNITEAQIIEVMKLRWNHIHETFAKKKPKLDYYIGLETDIQPDGKLALPEKAFEYLDYTVVSIHSSFGLNVQDMTARVLRALSYPKVKILGHPTGRLLGKREGYELDWEKIFTYCVEHNIAIEINSSPQRLDLPDTLVREGLKYKAKYMIDTDSHAVDQMDSMQYGVSVARRGWLTKNDVINTMKPADMEKWMGG